GTALVTPDTAEAQAAQHRAAGFVRDEDAADQLPEAGAVSGGQQRFHRGAAGAAAALGARDIDRELGDPGVAGAAAVGRAGGPGDDAALVLDHHHRIAPAEPGGDLIGRARLGLEGRDAVGDALIVDR